MEKCKNLKSLVKCNKFLLYSTFVHLISTIDIVVVDIDNVNVEVRDRVLHRTVLLVVGTFYLLIAYKVLHFDIKETDYVGSCHNNITKENRLLRWVAKETRLSSLTNR